ncbi:MAG: 2-phosphosulfolactate phosphatase [Pirellulales bacterium]|nr:2-phosphosulfolactate phosphatase [Pirellulales bacterium]|tara:strand:- start:2400 stop:3218 length:819 start_codon:yes stop_codon:yes gene_type:complete
MNDKAGHSNQTIRWYTHRLPDDMPRESVAGGIAIIVDVLRASTTIATALEAGAAFVKPVVEVEEAHRLRSSSGGSWLLGGERGGVQIPGFDLGNSPAEYCRSVVDGRGIILTTTNGTLAIERCLAAEMVLVGSFLNRNAVAKKAVLLASNRGIDAIHLVCAGTNGRETEEDFLGAGSIIHAGVSKSSRSHLLDTESEKASAEFLRVVNGSSDAQSQLVDSFCQSLGGRNLIELGMESDFVLAAAIDQCCVVPCLCPKTGRLVSFDAPQCIRK